MKGSVLVLNASYEYLNVTTVRRALSLVLKRKAEIVEAISGKAIAGVSRRIGMPSVVRMLYYIRRPFKEVPLTRKNVILRDRGTCQYCGRSGDTVDHIMPRSRGGRDSWENCVCACATCNRLKNNRTPDEANMRLLSKPRKPALVNWLMLRRESTRQGWGRYLGWGETGSS
jgi:5-methylcytosine-specific restriction endonuclease McrA